ncbi:protein similar isoform X2 [Toxorhynchites rutilus septentrionalis]|uniref:protein similar isoform X2 n=1 Tax=Toxorhynchites rutilus septentrionalis TaxID=329112 RepID=UPI0024793EEA|nr:protein similar isoform X2 [Toxorhynchites rutilus septentrionalis]
MTKTTTAKPKPVKEKRRNNEKRKEKSRDAARCRRSRETEIFQELAGLLPMRQEDVDHLDKASVMRLSIAYLRVRDMLELFPTSSGSSGAAVAESEIKEDDAEGETSRNSDESDGSVGEKKLNLGELTLENEKFFLQTLDGFLLVLSADGDVTYISENVSEYLGISQIDVMGQPIWEYSHQCDHEELREALNGRHHSPSELLKGVTNSECKPLENRDFFLRLKCTLTSRGRSVNIKSASYKVIHVTGHIACKENGQRQLVAVARPLPHPSNIEVPLDSSTFLSKHSLDMKFSYVDDKMFTLLGYNPADLMGKPFYECHHGIDSENLMGTFKNVISKGQSETARYRFLARTGGYAWVVTQATLIYDKQKPHSIVCVNYVISGVENKDEIYSCAQLEARQQKSTTESVAPQATTTAAAVSQVAAVVELAVAPSRDIVPICSDKVLKENVNHNNTIKVKPLVIAPASAAAAAVSKDKNSPLKEEVIKVIGPVPNGSTTVVRKVPYATATPSTARSVSVTASIFNTVAKKGPTPAASSSSTTATPPAPAAEIKSPVRKVPQSVTAKLFVTLNPQSTSTTSTPPSAATAANCNKPKHATEKIFAPRTKDMNKGFLMFSEEEPGLTMLKDEPDDLTHLAPTAGDACIPLEETGQFFNDVFDDFMIPESYSSLLQDELSSLDSAEHRLGSTAASIVGLSVASPITINGTMITTISHQSHHHSNDHNSHHQNQNNSSLSSPSSITSSSPVSLGSPSSSSSISSRASSSSGIGSSAASSASSNSVIGVGPSSGQAGASSNDPFINYRDEIGEISHSPHLLSPELSKSPEGSSIPSLCSPNGSGCPEDELAFMTLNMDDDLDLSMRAPYISMSEVDDLPLLTSEDLMWGAPPTSIEQHASSLASSIKEEFSAHNHNHNQHHQSQSDGHKSATVTSNGLRNGLNSGSGGGGGGSIDRENNCNIGNKIIDSSLAALLCGGNVINIQTSTIHQQQSQNEASNRQILIQQQPLQQQQQQQVLVSEVQQQQQREVIGEKRIKLIESNLVHPMVVISPGYKTSNTIEAWTMNDLLQLNGTGGGSGGTSNTKLNATLIASIVSKKNSTASNGQNNNNNNNRSTPPTTTTATATILTGSHHHTNKRSLATSDADDGSSKRVKSSQSSPTAASPQLLQQLMAPSPIPAKAKSKSKSVLEQSADGRWPATAKVNGLQGQASNSVLMNLLVSGCDNNIPKFPPEILIAKDETSQSTILEPNELLKVDAGDDDDDGPPILANPMLCSTAAPLTIQTDEPPSTVLFGRNVGDDDAAHVATDDDFLMTVSPNLLTPTDLELWRAIQQHGLDPKQISPLPTRGGYGLSKAPKSLTTSPTAQLEDLLLLPGCSPRRGPNLLSVLDPAMAISTVRADGEDSNGQDEDEDYEMTIPVNEILQNNLI